MDAQDLVGLGQVAGLGGIALGVILLLFKDIVRANFLGRLTAQQSYRVVTLMIVLTFIAAGGGLVTWAAGANARESRAQTEETRPPAPVQHAPGSTDNASNATERPVQPQPLDEPKRVQVRVRDGIGSGNDVTIGGNVEIHNAKP